MICRLRERGHPEQCTRQGGDACTIGQPTLPQWPSRGAWWARRRG